MKTSTISKALAAALLVWTVGALTCAGQAAPADSPPIVTIDQWNNFCINGQPTFLTGTMGGDDYDWQQYLSGKFNFRFLGSTAIPGAHSVGLWELPDVFDDPSQIATMKSDPYYLMWDLCYQIDESLQDSVDWVGHTPIDIVNKRAECLSYDDNPARPIGVCWGNQDQGKGSEFWGADGYWHSYRHYAQLVDYFVSGDFNWHLSDETISHAVRTTPGPVIALNRAWPLTYIGNGSLPSVPEVNKFNWVACIVGAKGIILDRFEMQDDEGVWQNWVSSIHGSWWEIIQKNMTEILSLSEVWAAPGPWMVYKIPPIEFPEDYAITYTYRKVGSDLYFIACNLQCGEARSGIVQVPIVEPNAIGAVLFDYLTKGAVMMPPTSTTITDTTKNWVPNELAGHRLWVTKRSTGEDLYYPIVGNTNNTITIGSGDFLADGVARGDTFKVIELVQLNNRRFTVSLEPGGRKVIRFENVTYPETIVKTPAAAAVPSNRKWVLLMDTSAEFFSDHYIVDGYGLCYDAHRHRLVAQGGLKNPWPAGKPVPEEPDVWQCRSVWEWDIDTGFFSGPIQNGDQQGGDPWPGTNWYHDMVYDENRQCTVAYHRSGEIQEWRGVEQGWHIIPPEPVNRQDPGTVTHYAACYIPTNGHFLLYGGKNWDNPGPYYRGTQFIWEWFNELHSFDGTEWHRLCNSANLPCTALEEPVMCWDSNRNRVVLFGLSHDGRYDTTENPRKFFQSTCQQTYEMTDWWMCNRKYTAHVPYVYANYQMVFDPRTNTTLLFGGLPSVNGRGTDLYEYNGTDWVRADYDDSALSAQDARRIPTLTYDPDHQMVLFLDTREGKIWGLTSGLETEAASIEDAKSLPDGTLVLLEGGVVGRNFGSYFYMQDEDRLSGIRVVYESGAAVPGKIVNVVGTMGTLATGERQILAQGVGTAGDSELRPLALTTKALGGTATATTPGVHDAYGINNIGITVTVCGEVTYAGGDYIYIDDGAGISDGSGHIGVKVRLNGIPAPSSGSYAAVTGISGVEEIAGHNARVLLVSQASDLVAM